MNKLKELIKNSLSDYEVVYSKVCDYNYKSYSSDSHSEGEYSIEIVIKKVSNGK